MIEPKDDKQMDDLLDSLLADYSAVDPRLGLEIRIRAGLRVQAARQQRRWVLALAVSAAVVVLAVVIAKSHMPHAAGQGDIAIQKSTPAPALGSAGTVAPSARANATEVMYGRRAKVRVHTNTPILLQIANAVSAEDNLVFEHQKLYLSANAQQEQEPKADEQPSAPGISIQHLDVRPIEIKDISSAKDIGSER